MIKSVSTVSVISITMGYLNLHHRTSILWTRMCFILLSVVKADEFKVKHSTKEDITKKIYCEIDEIFQV